MEVVGGSIPLATTISPTWVHGIHPTARLSGIPHPCPTGQRPRPERHMLKFLGSAVGIIFLIGLVVVILLLKLIF